MIKLSLLQQAPTFVVAIIIFILIIGFYLIGFRIRAAAEKKNSDQSKEDLGALNGTLLGILGLLLAFTFGMSNSRFDARRQVIIQEANDIGTVILRTDFFPDSVRQLLRSNLKEYVVARVAFYEARMNLQKVSESYLKADSIGKVVWGITASYGKVNSEITRTSQLVQALNDMIDITTTRRAAGEATVPDSIMYFLFILCCCSAFLLGYDTKHKIDWIVLLGLAIILSSTIFTIIDLDRPRSGLIKMDNQNRKMVELLNMFDEKK
jgi:hypothetical protein